MVFGVDIPIVDDAVDFVKDAGNKVKDYFGGEEWQGGQRPDPLTRGDMSSPTLQHGGDIRQSYYEHLSDVRGREAPQSQSAQLGAVERAATGQVGEAERIRAAQLGDAAQSTGAQLAPATTAQRAVIGPASQAGGVNINQDPQAQFRAAQSGLLGQLQGQAAGTGPSVASMEASRAAAQNARQQFALSRSGRGGNQGALARQASRSITDFNTAAAQEAIIGRQREQQAGQQMLGQFASQGRAQDIGLATSQAGMEQATQLANMQAANEAAFRQGQIDQATYLANQQAFNQFALTEGQFAQQSGLANQAALNQFMLSQAGFDQQASLANQAAGNQFALTQAQLDQQANLFNAGQGNQFTLQQGQFDQQTNLANMEAQLRMTGMNDAAIRGVLQDLTGMDAAELNARLQQDQMLVQQAIGYAPTPGMEDKILGLGGGVLQGYFAGKSDVRVKDNIDDGRSQIEGILSTGFGGGRVPSQTTSYAAPRGNLVLATAPEVAQSPAQRPQPSSSLFGGDRPSGGFFDFLTALRSGNAFRPTTQTRAPRATATEGGGLQDNARVDGDVRSRMATSRAPTQSQGFGSQSAGGLQTGTNRGTSGELTTSIRRPTAPVRSRAPAQSRGYGVSSVRAAEPSNRLLTMDPEPVASQRGSLANSAFRFTSDEEEKGNIQSGQGELIPELLENSKGYEYDYKNPERDGHGRRLGPMAQDLEKSRMGQEMVTDTPDGKQVTINPMTGLAIDSFLWEEIQKLKKGDR